VHEGVLVYMSFPRERVNREVKRRVDVLDIFPNDEAIVRFVGALVLEANDEWAVTRRYMSLETLARITDNSTIRLPAVSV
jgi:putative transposase